MTPKSHSTQTEVSDLSQDRHVKDFQPINFDYTGSPVNVTVPQGVQGVLFARRSRSTPAQATAWSRSSGCPGSRSA